MLNIIDCQTCRGIGSVVNINAPFGLSCPSSVATPPPVDVVGP